MSETVGAFDGQTQRIRISNNWIYDNGNVDSIYEHNSYTAAIDIVFEGNHYGPLRTDCLGNNLKDRSAGLVVRYNWIESGNRQLDLVDASGSGQLWLEPEYGATFVYGNVLVDVADFSENWRILDPISGTLEIAPRLFGDRSDEFRNISTWLVVLGISAWTALGSGLLIGRYRKLAAV